MNKKPIGYAATALIAGVLLSLTGCGSSAPAAAPAVVTPTVRETVTAPPATPAPSPSSTPAAAPTKPAADPAPEVFKMPNLVGENLQLAQDKLQALGSYVMDQEDAAGLSRLQVNDSNWKVCRQSPAAGKKVPVETLVLLSSVKLSETCP